MPQCSCRASAALTQRNLKRITSKAADEIPTSQAKAAHFSLSFMCGPHFYSMKITEDVRKFTAAQKISEEQALQVGLEQKSAEFVEQSAEVCAKT